ncbi:amino acid ABC transporter permease [Granulosicoccus antarcticus]|uniref:Putative glutamine ABC transporter permease protein GlnM n=1 Tax=Granulosicoccus antarcticus IMCC3135 TaxID=1192854 RepID=A0A2Z2NKS6_9GAMM|nr:amino acid ABC transporter permease [Granulosicoccus antarcticus]ASJ71759.1 putative glutamine ABC transporter permease protein GlnM [Granulosicoccus antarcticus IMCC3135]
MANSSPSSAISAASKPSFWRDPDKRAIVYQLVVVAVIGWLLYSIINNTATNMEARGLASGFGFLDSRAGFGIISTPFVPYTEDANYFTVFLVGLVNTIIVAFVGCLLALLLGFVVGIGRLSSNWLVQKIATSYIELFRNIPLLLQILFWYSAVLKPLPGPRELHEAGEMVFFSVNNRGLIFAEPVGQEGFQFVWYALFAALAVSWLIKKWAAARQMQTGEQFPVLTVGMGLVIGAPLITYLIMGRPLEFMPAEMSRFALSGGVTIIPEFVALLLALVIYTAAFIAEIVRAGIQSVSHGQTEAASALGVKPSHRMRLVVVPQAMRVIVPPLTSQFLNLTKNSSLATAIAYPDLFSVFAGTTLNQTGQAVEIMAMTLAVYLTLSLVTSGFMNWYNSRIKLVER